ncbi:hypothetical protein BHE74_00028197 [Ensete ventricosum]|nr:hypothetical protein BHE74_00028197 [Ensete ventricosum]
MLNVAAVGFSPREQNGNAKDNYESGNKESKPKGRGSKNLLKGTQFESPQLKKESRSKECSGASRATLLLGGVRQQFRGQLSVSCLAPRASRLLYSFERKQTSKSKALCECKRYNVAFSSVYYTSFSIEGGHFRCNDAFHLAS